MRVDKPWVTLFFVALMLTGSTLLAQTGLQGGMGFLVGIPQQDFADQVGTGGGFGGEFLYSPSSSPLALGISLNYLIYGSETRREPFSTTIPDVEVDVTTTNSIVLGHLLLRAQTKEGPIQPYLDGLLGFDYLFTETSIHDDDWDDDDYDDDDEIASTTNFDDTAFSWGFGGGCMIPVWENEMGTVSVLVDLQGHYLRGGEAEYLKKGSIRRENGKVTYDVSKSETDLLLIKVGASVRF
jgi:hypothetical protein